MKKFLLVFAITITLASIVVPIVVTSSPVVEPLYESPDTPPIDNNLSEEHRERVARRRARQKAFEHFIDSTILSHNYRFLPTMFNVEPAGSSHLIVNPAVELAVYSDWADVNLPVFQGFTPPYRVVMYNTPITDLSDFTTEETDNGWMVTFSAWLYSSDDYTFSLEVYSKTGGATLSISSNFNPTTTYWGSISAIY
jgi:hypothetical protein